MALAGTKILERERDFEVGGNLLPKLLMRWPVLLNLMSEMSQ